MPGFVTHYLFGAETYKRQKSEELRRLMRENHSAYALGLQGPDVFFYYLPSYFIHKQNIGALAHDKDTRAFFSYLLESRFLFKNDTKKQEIADAYIIGFFGHYTLDCTVHPYVYAFTSFHPEDMPKQTEYFGQHAYFETELDNRMLWLCRHLRPSEFHQNATIHLGAQEKNVISQMLVHAYRNTYNVYVTPRMMRQAMRWMETGTRLVRDPSGQKKVMVRLAEKLVLHRPLISAMIPSDRRQFVMDPFNYARRRWRHPWTKEVSDETFPELFEKAGRLYDMRLQEYAALMEGGFPEEGVKAFEREYGNRSFLSGKPLR